MTADLITRLESGAAVSDEEVLLARGWTLVPSKDAMLSPDGHLYWVNDAAILSHRMLPRPTTDMNAALIAAILRAHEADRG